MKTSSPSESHALPVAAQFVIGSETGTIYRNGDPTGTEVHIFNERILTRAELLQRLNSHDELLAALESLLPLAVHTSPQDVSVNAARVLIAKLKDVS